jgi:hypothetical protein
MNDVVPLVQLGDEHSVEEDGPEPVVGFFEADVMVRQAIGDEEQVVLEAKCPTRRDLFHQEVAGVLLLP